MEALGAIPQKRASLSHLYLKEPYASEPHTSTSVCETICSEMHHPKSKHPDGKEALDTMFPSTVGTLEEKTDNIHHGSIGATLQGEQLYVPIARNVNKHTLKGGYT